MSYRVIRTILKIFKPIFRIEVNGKENIPNEDGYILCANHSSNWDPIFLAISFDDQIHFMAKKELFDVPFLGWFVSRMGAFPVDREGRDLKSLKDAIGRLNDGEILGIMPEGTRVHDIDRANMKEGVSYIALKSKADILPVEIISTFIPFKKSYIYIKEPIRINRFLGEKSKIAMKDITDELFKEIYEVHTEEKLEKR